MNSPERGSVPTRSTDTAGLTNDELLALLLDEREISRLLVALSRCVDTYDFAGLAELYADEGELVTPWGSHKGRAGLADYVSADLGHHLAMHHMSAGHEIHVTPGASVARVRTSLFAVSVADEAGRDLSATGGHYEMDLVRERGAWRLKRNQIVPAWYLNTDSPHP